MSRADDMARSSRKRLGRAVRYVRKNPLIVAGAVGAAAAFGTVAYAILYHGDSIVLYGASGSGVGEIRSSAERIARDIGASTYPVTNGQEILDAIRRHPRIKRLVLVGHSTTTAFLRPRHSGIRVGRDALPTWVGVETFARELAPRMTVGGWVGWAGCSIARNPSQPSYQPASYGPGGEDVFMAAVRDAMARAGTLWGVRHGGHSDPGHVTANPSARVCPVSSREVGQPCYSVLNRHWGDGAHRTRRQEWISEFQGVPAERWISTGEVSV